MRIFEHKSMRVQRVKKVLLFALMVLIGGFSACTDVADESIETPSRSVSGREAATEDFLFSTCTACHGAHGQGNRQLHAPSIAGHEPWYLQRQLKNYRDGIRGTHPDDLHGATMNALMATYDDETIAALANIIAEMPVSKNPPVVSGHARRGMATWNDLCSACHGSDGMGNVELNAPRLAGTDDWYLERQLHGYREGWRGTHENDAFGKQMLPMAQALADDEAIRDVVSYIATLEIGGQ
jgi:cytochrome c oxidase subunit 2